MQIEQLYPLYREDLFKLAYRMLGTVAEAEDVVQDVFVTLHQLDNRNEISHWKAFLMRMTTNRCINVLKSARRTRVIYPGTWLPEPLFESADQPQDVMERREGLSYALLALLESLTPSERAVYVLRTAYDFTHPEIADMLGKTVLACRKSYSRAIAKLGTHQSASSATRTLSLDSRFADAFIHSIETGNYRELVELLSEDVTMWSDGGGVVRSALNPIYGANRTIAFLEGVASKKDAMEGEWRKVVLNGQKSLVMYKQNIPSLVICADFADTTGKINHLFWIRNPRKIDHLPTLSPDSVTL